MPGNSRTPFHGEDNRGETARHPIDLTTPEPVDTDMVDQTAGCQISSSLQNDSDDSLRMSPSAFRFSQYSQSAKGKAPARDDGLNIANTAMTTIVEEEEEEDEEESIPSAFRAIEKVDYAEIIPFRLQPPSLDNLPLKILKMILGHVFTVGDTIVPWFFCGFLDLGVRGFSLNDSHVTFRPNLDVAFLRLNKACYRVGTDILYGENHFKFERAELCLWWLRRIGDSNISKIRMVTFNLNTGWRGDLRDPKIAPCCFECSHEKNWAKCLDIIRHAHPKLDYFNAATIFWTPMEREPLYDEESKAELRRYRKVIFDTIAKFRDVKKAVLRQFGDPYVSAHELAQLMLLMQQRGWTRPDTPPMPKMSFAQMMERVKAENEETMRRALKEAEEKKAKRAAAARNV